MKRIAFIAFFSLFVIGIACDKEASDKSERKESPPQTYEDLLAKTIVALKAAADNKSGALSEFGDLFQKLKAYPEFPKSFGGDENGGNLAWFLSLNDPKLLRFGMENRRKMDAHDTLVGDYHSMTVVGKTIGKNPKDLFGYPILNVLKKINEPGQKELVKTFFTFKSPDKGLDSNNTARHRLLGTRELDKLWIGGEFKEAAENEIPADLKAAQKLAKQIDDLGWAMADNIPELTKKISEILQ